MLNEFEEIKPVEITGNAFKMIGHDAFLITAGNIKDDFNTMTASWGGFGFLWKKPVVYIFVRPVRWTYQFTEKNEFFTISFFKKEFSGILDYCGTFSGRDKDKIRETGLTPVETHLKNIIFDQSWLALECRKLYFHDIDPQNFYDQNLLKNYPEKDYHRFYVGEVVNVFKKQST